MWAINIKFELIRLRGPKDSKLCSDIQVELKSQFEINDVKRGTYDIYIYIYIVQKYINFC